MNFGRLSEFPEHLDKLENEVGVNLECSSFKSLHAYVFSSSAYDYYDR